MKFSRRECQTLRALLSGKSRKAIAEQLAIRPSTAAAHITYIGYALGLTTRPEITRWCLTHPEALRGGWADRKLHPDDCPCPRPFCSANREAA